MELVSVVIPVYNAESYLRNALSSVFNQTYPDIEVIAVDDGSSDRSIEILESLARPVRVIRQVNAGAAAARNRGIREARGDWVAFLDADDSWAPDKLAKQIACCGQFAWSHTDSVFVGGVNDGRRDSEMTPKYSGRVLDKLACSNFVGTSTVLARRDCLLELGGFDESLRSIQDWDLWVRMASRYELGYVDEPLLNYRVHSASTSRSTRRTLPNHLKVIEKIFGPAGGASGLVHLKPRAKASSYGICAQIAEEEGDFPFALHCWLGAARQQPAHLGYTKNAAKSVVKLLLSKAGIKI